MEPAQGSTDPAPAPVCRHEYVKIYQRRIKGLERRLVSTRAYLPVGFKMADFGHLSEGSYCFCTKCRARLFPKRTAAEKAAARVQAQNLKALAEEAMLAPEEFSELQESEAVETAELESSDDSTEGRSESSESSAVIRVEELEIDALELEEISESSSPDIEENEEE